eukprot:7050969-Pyramimonas_sp.AAC.2
MLKWVNRSVAVSIEEHTKSALYPRGESRRQTKGTNTLSGHRAGGVRVANREHAIWALLQAGYRKVCRALSNLRELLITMRN